MSTGKIVQVMGPVVDVEFDCAGQCGLLVAFYGFHRFADAAHQVVDAGAEGFRRDKGGDIHHDD